ncbi:glycosyltransferase [Flavivirga aquimarina]|uniref:Glycosyltransferase n=1 Tax=Flavivirga aquimarina TaxID=2027862 RepID=A0ABT8W704_9FLAO|nr:glycosyltransferase [Flavivirga aquimarina]MDO5968903.1 glycosyltransferase [Flavivirga aquimarina]
MNITFIMPWHISERGGGAEVQANYLALELANRGYTVNYICQTKNENKIDRIETVNHINIYWLKPSGRFPWLDQGKYYKPLHKIKPDIIIQRLTSNVNYIIGNYCKKNKARYCWVCTDNLSPFKNFHVKKFKERFNLKNTSLLKYVLFLINAKIMDSYRNNGMKHIDYGFSQNKFQKKTIKQNFDIETYTMITGHPKPQNNYSLGTCYAFQTVLWCANFGIHKRPELFVQLARHMQDTSIKFIMVGGHSDKAYMKDLLKDKPSNLYCTGHLPFERALTYFDFASIFINTSSPGGDGFPNTFVQAWLRKIPVISFGFNPDNIITKYKLGYNVESLDEGIEKLNLLMSNYKAYKEISDNAYKYGSKNHSIKIMTDNFLKTIKNESVALS